MMWKSFQWFFLTAIWRPHGPRPLSRGQPHSSDVNHCISTISTKKHCSMHAFL